MYVRNYFSVKYQQLYYQVCRYDIEEMSSYIRNCNSEIDRMWMSGLSYSAHSVNTDEVHSAISKLNRRQQDGDCGTSTDYLIHDTHKLNVHIALLFTTILKHGVVPNGFKVSTIIPIPKSKRKSINCYDKRPRGLDTLFGHLLIKRIPVMYKLSSTKDPCIFKSQVDTRS